MARLIIVDATPLGPAMSGSRRRMEELLRRLPALVPDDVFEVHWARDGGGPPAGLSADNLVHATVDVSCRGGAWRWLARRRDLARRFRATHFAALLVDHGPVIEPARVANVVTLHDLRFLRGYGGWARRLYGRWGYGALLRRAAKVVAVAPHVAREATERYGLDPARVFVAPNAATVALTSLPGAGRAGRHGLSGANDGVESTAARARSGRRGPAGAPEPVEAGGARGGGDVVGEDGRAGVAGRGVSPRTLRRPAAAGDAGGGVGGVAAVLDCR